MAPVLDQLPTSSAPAVPILCRRGLRFILLDLLMHRAEATVAELVDTLTSQGYHLDDDQRASRVVSDALRWEVKRGRVERVGRGRYRHRQTSPSTRRRVRLLGTASRTWLDAVAAGRPPPPTPPDPRRQPFGGPDDPNAPPWANLGWLWVA